MYDRNHDMKIDRTELLEVLKMMVGGNIHDDQIATIADHTIGELVIKNTINNKKQFYLFLGYRWRSFDYI
jgi:Ca2+-binding EF-hand superfamily protein